jgi:hypothetical protein
MASRNLNTLSDSLDISKQSAFHLAGIISLLGEQKDFNFPWHDCLIPIAADFVAIERAVLECATAGCETIWIVCYPDMQPLLKHRLGESVQDPIWFARRYDKFPSQSRRQIPIYYVECNPKDRNIRDSQVWGVLYGAKVAKEVSRSLTKWIEPDKYYVAFPLSVYPSQDLKPYREHISSPGMFFVTTDLGESILDGKKVAFAFDKKYLGELTLFFWRNATGLYDPSQPVSERRDNKYITKRLPPDQRYSGRSFTFEYIFGEINLEENTTWVEMKWYNDISSWDKWKAFMASSNADLLKRPKLDLLNAGNWKKIASEEE